MLLNDILPSEWEIEFDDPQSGLLIDLGNGLVSYTPAENFLGSDSFTYRVCSVDCPDLCDTASVVLQVRGSSTNNDCFVPNIITPNNDGINDALTIPCLEEYPDHTISIFNRWGDLVFKAAPYQKDWEGTHKHTLLPAGTYFYFIALSDNPTDQISGYFTIVR